MKKNESNTDRIIRAIIGIVLLALYFTNTITGTWGIVGLVVGIIALVTAATGFCGLYKLFGISTRK